MCLIRKICPTVYGVLRSNRLSVYYVKGKKMFSNGVRYHQCGVNALLSIVSKLQILHTCLLIPANQ